MSTRHVLVGLCLALATPLVASAQLTLVASSISSGGPAASGRFAVTCSITQPAAGQPLVGGRFVCVTGFLAPAVVTPPPACPADFNHSGDVDPDDMADYIGAYFSVPFGAGSDFNGDGETNPDDLADYLGAFFAGC